MKYKYQQKTADDSLKLKTKPKIKHNRQQFNKNKQINSLFFTALSKHALGAGPPKKEKNNGKELSKR